MKRFLLLPWYVKFPLCGIYLLAMFTIEFERTCESDGCIGSAIPLGVATILAALQIFLSIPWYVYSPSRKLDGALSPIFLIAATLLPLLLALLAVLYLKRFL